MSRQQSLMMMGWGETRAPFSEMDINSIPPIDPNTPGLLPEKQVRDRPERIVTDQDIERDRRVREQYVQKAQKEMMARKRAEEREKQMQKLREEQELQELEEKEQREAQAQERRLRREKRMAIDQD
jgi:hypothetical protein